MDLRKFGEVAFNVAACLADNFEIADYGVLCHLFLVEGNFIVFRCVILNTINRL